MFFPLDLSIISTLTTSPISITVNNHSEISGFQSASSYRLRPRQSPRFCSNNEPTEMQIELRACFALTVNPLSTGVCGISKTKNQHSIGTVQLTVPNVSSRYILKTSGDEAAHVMSQQCVGIDLSEKVSSMIKEIRQKIRKAEAVFLDCILAEKQLHALRLHGSTGFRKDCCFKCSSFFI